MFWLKKLKGRIRFKEPLSAHTTLQIGGPAEIWIEPKDYLELRKVIYYCQKEHIPYFVLGKGSNILVSDSGYKGAVISLNSHNFSKIKFNGTFVTCGAGMPLNRLIKLSQKKCLGGLEFLAGIPASVGGALVMNAGSPKNNIASLLKKATVMDKTGKIRVLERKQLKFNYRHSNLNRYIVLEAMFKLIKKDPKTIKKSISFYLRRKRETQDIVEKNAGCIFRNPHHPLTAGEMIEACGLKQKRKNNAEISSKHANYIINRNSAKAKDILYLMRLVQRRVKKNFGVMLRPEIIIIK